MKVEGYQTTAEALQGNVGVTDEWLDSLRREARRALIRRLILERIATGGYDQRPNPHDDGLSGDSTEAPVSTPWIPKTLEAVLIGVAVTVGGALACHFLGLGKGK